MENPTPAPSTDAMAKQIKFVYNFTVVLAVLVGVNIVMTLLKK